MKKIIAGLLIVFALVISCNKGKDKGTILQKPDDIKADEYVINIDKDTTLLTRNGALLKIPRGSLSSDKNTVILEIKEAYSLEQMIRTGLNTQSNGELLSSGGMIYINAKAGQDVRITQPIKVAIPSDNLRDSMQLFKGEKDADGNINWTSPTALPENKQLSAIQKGERLFMANCASCHVIGKDMTGPDLANILRRKHMNEEGGFPRMHNNPGDWYSLLTDSSSRYSHPRILYQCLINQYSAAAPTFFTLTPEEISSIYKYIQNESDKRDLPMPSHAWLDDCVDSCEVYLSQVGDLRYQKRTLQEKRDTAIRDNGGLVIEKNDWDTTVLPRTGSTAATASPVDFDEMVSPESYGSVYYQFTIETFGWFNIDILIKGQDGVEESELFVRIVGEYREKVQVYLIIPSEKVYVQGGPAERNSEEFAFLYKNGKIFLPQKENAYILAVTERESSVAFALKAFTTSTKQEFDISLQKSSKEEFSEALGSFSPPDMKIKVYDAKNANEIRKMNKDIKDIDDELKKAEHLKPKNCDCSCGENTAPVVSIKVADTLSSNR